ncbi:hypothetical protein SAMN04488070_1859 [Pseudidiomarina maritima]|uniref:Uncharacterized protein n=1 Tax=Pseudidiomarina maritima TaxID=519453 RepID=A0A1I6HJE9_9GAMM|nr:hypothetical protein SAMN04488070_1859 [Pseudidiomarina maritima]
MSFFKLYKLQLIVYFALAALVGGLISVESGLFRGFAFSIGCFLFLTVISYITYRKNLSKYGNNDIG